MPAAEVAKKIKFSAGDVSMIPDNIGRLDRESSWSVVSMA